MRRALLIAFSFTTAATLVTAQTRSVEPLSCDDVRDNDRDVSCEIRTETLETSSLDVDAGNNGGIRVRGWNGTTTQLRVMIAAHAGSEAEARNLASQVRVVTTGGRVRVEGPEPRFLRNRRNDWWSASFELQVPQNGSLTLNTRNGGIAIADFRGRADFRATNGGVSLTDVNGDIRGATTNGGVNVSLSGTRWDGNGLDVQTTNGGVRLLVPASYSAVLETGTVNGGLQLDFPVTVQGRLPGGRNRSLTATLGDGGARLRAVTTNGGVTISRR